MKPEFTDYLRQAEEVLALKMERDRLKKDLKLAEYLIEMNGMKDRYRDLKRNVLTIRAPM
jgi:hypothetical protein